MTRFVKLFYQIKNKLIIRLPQDQRQDFERELITENFSRLRFVSIVLFIIEAVLIIPENHPAQRYIMAAFLAANLILIPLIFLTSRRCYTVRIASAKIVMLSYTVVALLLGAGQALVVVRDMDITHVYLMSVFGIAMFLFIRPLPSALLFASVYVCFALALPHFGVPKDTLAAIRTNTLIFNLFAWILGQISLGHRMSVFANRKQLNEQNRLLEELAQRDAMTGLYHHTASLGLLEIEMNRARSNGAPMSLIMMDIDDFKRINDTYGHQYGDDIISRTAAVLNSVVRGNGIVGRYGGEEFIIILPGADINAARLLSRRIQSAMDGNISLPGITLSGGISCYRGQTLDEFVRLADERLYQAKTRGKSCFVSSADETLQKAVWYRL